MFSKVVTHQECMAVCILLHPCQFLILSDLLCVGWMGFFLNKFIYVFIYLFLAALGLRCCMWASLAAESGGYSLLRCAAYCGGFSLQSTGSRRAGFSSCGTGAQ